MSTTTTNLKRFADIIRTKPALQQQLKTANDEKSFIALYVRLAKENGCEISLQEVQNGLKAVKSKRKKTELTQQDLHAIAAGDGCDEFHLGECE